MKDKSLYLFCVTEGMYEKKFDWHGIEGKEVFPLVFEGFTVIAQACEPQPFTSLDNEVLKEWLLAHERVVEEAWQHFGTIIPFRFNTIIVPTPGKSAWQNCGEWIHNENGHLINTLNRLKNKAEYGVQILWNRETILDRIVRTDEEIKALRKDIQGKPEGVAYLLEKKIECLLKQRLEKKADTYFKIFYHDINRKVVATHIEKVRKEELPRQMILNISCLEAKDRIKELGDTLEKITNVQGFEVRFTGPWPPYSFVNS